MSNWTNGFLCLAAALSVAASACSDTQDPTTNSKGSTTNDAAVEDRSSGSTCPSGSTLTYDTFGRTFMETYCVRCHSSSLVGPTARSNAPDGFNFDSLVSIRLVEARIDEMAAAGPTRTNEFMPIGTPQPTTDGRRQLGEWLACDMRDAGAP